jgi:transcriptional regulator with XRE-family HTH domain
MRAAASAAGVSNTTWSRVEAGAVPITPQMSQAIAGAFGWPADWESLPPETLGHPLSNVAADDLLDRIRAELDEHERRIESMLKRYAKGTDASDDDGRDGGAVGVGSEHGDI